MRPPHPSIHTQNKAMVELYSSSMQCSRWYKSFLGCPMDIVLGVHGALWSPGCSGGGSIFKDHIATSFPVQHL